MIFLYTSINNIKNFNYYLLNNKSWTEEVQNKY